MNKTLRNFWLDVTLYLLLGVNITLVNLTPQNIPGVHPGLGWHIHALIGMVLVAGSLVHIVWHWQWFHAVLTGKAKGKIKLGMISMVTVMMVLASLSGHDLLTSASASNFHNVTGSIVLIGLFIHSVKHIRWMAMISKRLIARGTRKHVISSAQTE